MFVVNNTFKNANIPRTIRFTEKLFDELHQMANVYEISFNLLVLQCCQFALDESEIDINADETSYSSGKA